MQKNVQELDIYPNYGQMLANKKGLKRLIYKVIPPLHTYLPFREELNLAWIRFKSRNVSKQYDKCKDLLVNLGAGYNGKPGWINVDAFHAPGINCIYDCRKSLPFPDNSVKGIFSEHFF